MRDIEVQFIEGAARAMLPTQPLPVEPYYLSGMDEACLSAAQLLGMLKQANGCGLQAIIEAAWAADGKLDSETEMITGYVAEFARLTALQAIGAGVSWFDEHARFTLPRAEPPRDGDDECSGCAHRVHAGRCVETTPHGRCVCSIARDQGEFIVPRYEFTV